MNDQTADREGLAEVLLRKFQTPEHEWARRDLMLDALEDADAILASPQFARIIAEAEARAWDEGCLQAVRTYHDTEGCECGGECFKPSARSNPYRAALVAPDAGGEG